MLIGRAGHRGRRGRRTGAQLISGRRLIGQLAGLVRRRRGGLLVRRRVHLLRLLLGRGVASGAQGARAGVTGDTCRLERLLAGVRCSIVVVSVGLSLSMRLGLGLQELLLLLLLMVLLGMGQVLGLLLRLWLLLLLLLVRVNV